MMRWLTIANRGAVTLAAVLCVAAATPLAAQQTPSPAPQAGDSVVQASAARTALPGPRLRPEWQRMEPSLAGRSASALVAPPDRHTITVSTLVLVLVVIIAVLLIAR